MKNATTITVTLPDEHLSVAKNLAQLEGKSLDDFLANAVRAYQLDWVRRNSPVYSRPYLLEI